MTTIAGSALVTSAALALKERADEVNRLNVFPVPDGDTGTNMSLTMDVVVAELGKLGPAAPPCDVCKAVTHGSLMGARGNSGVILSQILRGLCEGVDDAETIDTEVLAEAFERSVTVAFQAVRRPVEGTILTVLRDTAVAARSAAEEGLEIREALRRVAAEAFESTKRTPELLPVLRENGVVDAGGFGLAILIEGFVAAALGSPVMIADVSSAAAPLLHVVPIDDWDDAEYLYCTEFLLFSDIQRDDLVDYVASVGGSELVVGANGEYKVHVHTNDPGSVLGHMTTLGEVAEVHVNNMRKQSEARDAELARVASEEGVSAVARATKPLGFVAVATGEGLAEILRSLGVDQVVSGGQTMNPSTQDLLAAINAVPAEQVIILPNNKNIVMAANAAASVASKPVVVIPTTTVPESFSAMLAYDGGDDIARVAEAMAEAIAHVYTGEVTRAIKDAKSKVGPITGGQVIGIRDHEIEVVGEDVTEVAVQLAEQLLANDVTTLTLLSGENYSDADADLLAARIADAHPTIEIETHRGGQPLYPVILAAE
jgi:uncharacterized protein